MKQRKNISQDPQAWAKWEAEAIRRDLTLSYLIFEAMNAHLGLSLTRNQKKRPSRPKRDRKRVKRK